MTSRRAFLALLGTCPAICLGLAGATAQTPRPLRLGYLDLGSSVFALESGRLPALIHGLHDLGYRSPSTLSVDLRFADGDSRRLRSMARDLVAASPDVLVVTGAVAAQILQMTTTEIPIVITATPDPVRDGFALSLPRPGGNITGLSSGAAEIAQKHVELLSMLVPEMRRIAILLNPANSAHGSLLLRIRNTLDRSTFTVIPVLAGSPDELHAGFAAMAERKAHGLIVLIDTFFVQARQLIVDLARKQRVPSVYPNLEYARDGGLLSYASDINANFRRAATFVDRIARGADPAVMPFELPTRYQLVVNRRAAQEIGLRLSDSVLGRADELID